MKPYIDFQASLTSDMLACKKFKNRLIRYWGTTYVNGVHVFNKTYQFFPHHKREQHRRLYRLLGIDQQMMETHISRSQVDEAHFFFKKNVWTGRPPLERTILTTRINSFYPGNTKKTITLKMYDNSNPLRFKGWTKQQILDYVDTNYAVLLNSTYVEVSTGSMAEDAVAMYAMLDDQGIFKIDVISAVIISVKTYKSGYVGTTSIDEEGGLVYDTKDIVSIKSGIHLTIEVTKLIDVWETSNFINALMRENSELRLRNLQMLQSSTENISYQEALRRELDLDNNDTEESNYFIGKHLKVACADSYFMNRKKFISNVFASLDTKIEEKEQEKMSTWDRILLIVIVIIVIVITVVTGGFGSGLSGAIAGLATAATIVTFTFIAIQMMYAQSGENAKAEGMGSWVKVSGIISTVLNIINIINNFAKEFGKEAAKEAATESAKSATTETATTAGAQAGTNAAVQATATEVGKEVAQESLETFLQNSTKTIIAPATEGVSMEAGKVAVTYGGKTYIEIGVKKIVSKALELVMDLVSKREKARVVDATQRKTYLLNEANEEVANTNQQLMELDDRTIHMGVTDIIASTKLLKTSQAQFEVDYLYEGSAFNIGRPSFRPYGLNERVKIEYKI